MGVKVTQQGVGDPPQALRPCPQTICAIDTQTQNLGLDPSEPVKSDLVRRDLARSDWRPG